jgi:copper homeostasis protein CutC
VIATGADCLLTSGGAPNVLAGVDCIAQLLRQADGRIEIMVGGGLTLASLAEVAERTGVTGFHASLRRKNVSTGNGHLPGDYPCDILSKDIAESLHLLDDAFAHQSVEEVHSR